MKRTLAITLGVLVLVSVYLWWTRSGGRVDCASPAAVDGTPTAAPEDEADAVVTFAGPAPAPGGHPLYDPVVVGPRNLAPVQEQEGSSHVDGMLREVLSKPGE